MWGSYSGNSYNYIGYAPNDDNGNPDYPDGAIPLDPLTFGGTNPWSTTKYNTQPGFQRGNPKKWWQLHVCHIISLQEIK
jgi:hypothetical protein